MSKSYRTFAHLSRAWYGASSLAHSDYVDEVIMADTRSEMAMRWYSLLGEAVPRLECFNDSFHVLAEWGDVFARLAKLEGRAITPAQFCQLLTECKFEDKTPERNPKEPESPKADGTEQAGCDELREVAKALREWIDAVPEGTQLPAMPGLDRDWVDAVIGAGA